MTRKAAKEVKHPSGEALEKALEFVEQRLQLLKPLVRRRPFNDEWIRWSRATVSGIKEHFGEGADEYRWVSPFYPPVVIMGPESPDRKAAREREQYSERVRDIRNALQSILDKHAALGPSMPASQLQQQQVRAKAFISHGGRKPSLAIVEDFLRALGVEPIVVEKRASEGREAHDNVDKYRELSDFAIVLWTRDVEDAKGDWLPSGSVAVESGELRVRFGDRVIYLKEEGVRLPTMGGTTVYEPFSEENMAAAFQKIVTELHTWGWLKVAPKQGRLADSPAAASPDEVARPAKEAGVPEEEGIWDWIVQTQESLDSATQEVLDMTAALKRMSKKIKSRTARLEQLNEQSGPRTAALVHALLSVAASDMMEYTEDTRARMPRYRDAWEGFEKSTTSLIASPLASTAENREGFQSLRGSIDGILPNFEVVISGMRTFQGSVDGLKGLSRDLNAASKNMNSVLAQLIEEIEKSRSICTRVAALLDEVL